MMKWRENVIMKALAFMAAVAAFTATAIMGWYQLANFDALWSSANDHDTMGYTSYFLLNQDSYGVRSLVGYYELQAAGHELSLGQKRELEWLEERFDPQNTNLRWQLLDQNGQMIYGNTWQSDLSLHDNIYWYDYPLSGLDAAEEQTEWIDWQEVAGSADAVSISNAGDFPLVCRNDLWQQVLPGLVTQARNDMDRQGGALPEPDARYPLQDEISGAEITIDTALTDQDGRTLVLEIRTRNGSIYVYPPTIRACLGTNRFGYSFDPYDLTWVQESSPEQAYAPLVLWADRTFSVDDQYRAAHFTLENWRSLRTEYLTATIACAAVGLVLLIFLCCAAGHKRGVEGIYLNWFHRIPGDALLTLLFLGGLGAATLSYEMLIVFYGDAPMYVQLICLGTAMAAAAAMGMAALITVCARAKAHTLLRDTLTFRVLRWGAGVLLYWTDTVRRMFRAIPLIWKAVLSCMAYMLFTIVTVDNGNAAGLWLIVTVLAALYLCLWAYQWKKIRIGAREIIGGNPDYHIDTARMLPDLRSHADELNNLGHAISTAVDDRMKSEHFKAELITNVSHDLKTPLTSIINYVDLLKKEQIDNPRAAEYIEVLDRKSQRLKKLTEDLVEASKASTGSLTVNWERIGLTELADQALAEYAERLDAKGLSVVRTFPDSEVWVQADGRHLWRVLDNLLSNCAKYALEGTRVYLEIRRTEDRAELAMKNISRDALNVAPDELLERFVRGDESRTTEGSGLGLSIAQSLTELQGGRFSLTIDGDLFKAIVTLPLAEDGNGPLPFLLG